MHITGNVIKKEGELPGFLVILIIFILQVNVRGVEPCEDLVGRFRDEHFCFSRAGLRAASS